MDYEKAYGQMHDANDRSFSGYSIKRYVQEIAALVSALDSWPQYNNDKPRLLDYGSGKGYQYLAKRVH